ncbi:ribonuclease P protein component [Lipingzhangella halophila]|uniref:Ribonuclease P protein component n=1 Tax=Lipingzhangella halophila TaxID=1783352 RepID=A0A7W7RPC0_9ACTN|nr:ribonuclease P protein component [Lipingzhangella halophila]MBB4935422.1 ribonuclease P protein component [Lipingzhangella halophila]
MLSPQNRMRRSADFGLVMRRGRRANREALGVAYLAPYADPDHGSAGPPKVGLIVSKAVGNAVVRHRVQRRLRHLVRERLPVLPDGSLLVVRAKPLAASQGHDALAAQLDGALASAMRPRNKATRRPRGPGAGASNGARDGGDLADS